MPRLIFQYNRQIIGWIFPADIFQPADLIPRQMDRGFFWIIPDSDPFLCTVWILAWESARIKKTPLRLQGGGMEKVEF